MMSEVGWTIRKISRKQVNMVADWLIAGNPVQSISQTMNLMGMSERDVAGVVSYILSGRHGLRKELPRPQRIEIAKWLHGKRVGKTGEVNEFSEVHKQLKEGKAADVNQIIQMLRSEVTSKEAQIGLDELGKYTSRPEVTVEASEVGTIGGSGRSLGDNVSLSQRKKLQAAYDRGYADGERNERARKESEGRTIDYSPGETGAIESIIGKAVPVLAKRFGVSEKKVLSVIRGEE